MNYLTADQARIKSCSDEAKDSSLNKAITLIEGAATQGHMSYNYIGYAECSQEVKTYVRESLAKLGYTLKEEEYSFGGKKLIISWEKI